MLPRKKIARNYNYTNVEPITFAKLDEETQSRIDRISEEFKNGFTLIKNPNKSVTFWGSARTPSDDPMYIKAEKLAARISTELGHTILTGGGPGIMAAGNCGAYDAGGKSMGLTIKLPFEQKTNLCLTHHMDFKYFFARKVCLAFASESYVYFPGGFGTLDELFEILTLVQTKKIDPAPSIILVGKKYWKGLDKFIKKTVLKEQMISPEDLNLYTITDDEEEIINLIKKSPAREATILASTDN
ncbi:MAG: TIGR00730 family Rossman fold protein [Candidatus Paceibacterota bacterium]